MTRLLAQAFDTASKLPATEQDLLAERLLAELAAESAFDEALSRGDERLAILAAEAIAEHRAGLTKELEL